MITFKFSSNFPKAAARRDFNLCSIMRRRFPSSSESHLHFQTIHQLLILFWRLFTVLLYCGVGIQQWDQVSLALKDLCDEQVTPELVVEGFSYGCKELKIRLLPESIERQSFCCPNQFLHQKIQQLPRIPFFNYRRRTGYQSI
jgi:hypothetical protein